MPRTSNRRTQLGVELQQQRAALRQQRARDRRVLEAIYTISLACRARPSLEEIFTIIYQELARLFDFDACFLALCDEMMNDHFSAALLVDEGVVEFATDSHYGPITGQIVREREPRLFRDLVAEHPDRPAGETMFGNLEKRSRSWLGVPLMVGTDAVGVISLQSYRVGVYDEGVRDLLQRIANVIGVALENVSLIDKQRQLSQALSAQVLARTEELDALSQIASLMVLRRPLAEVFDRALEVILGLFRLSGGNVRLLNGERDTLVLMAQRGFPERYSIHAARSPLLTSPLQAVVDQNEVQMVEREWRARLDPLRFPPDIFPAFEAALSLPLSINGTVLGTLSMFGAQPYRFSKHEIDLAQAVANQLAIVVDNSRLLAEHERQIAELQALGAIGRAASMSYDLDALLRHIHDALRTCISLDAFSMVIYNPDTGLITAGLSIDEGIPYRMWSGELPPPASLTASIIRRGMPLSFGDLPVEIEQYPDLEAVTVGSMRVARAWVGMPLFDREQRVIGVITIQSYTPFAFDERDSRFMHDVAAQVALHVQNIALLFQRERQIKELDAIGRIGQLATAGYNLDEILDGVRSTLLALTEASVFYLLICDPDSGVITHSVFVEEGEHFELEMLGKSIHEGSLSEWIVRNREPLLFRDLPTQGDELKARGIQPIAIGPEKAVRSWAGVPLLARDGAQIGVLSLQDYRPYRYDSQTIDFLSQVASHISLGVQKVRLIDERERQVVANAQLFLEAQAHAEAAEREAYRLQLVNRIAAVLSTRLDEHEILDLAAHEFVKLFWADHTGIVIFDDALEQGFVAADHPGSGVVGQLVTLKNNPLVEQLLATRRPVAIPAIDTGPLTADTRDSLRTMGIVSLVVVPLISRDKVIGSISLDSYAAANAYGAADKELMMTVASSMAVAIENARLFAAEQQARRTADTLREMARVTSSSFDPAEVLRLILAELQRVINYDSASVMLLEGETLRIAAAQGLPLEGDSQGFAYGVQESAAGQVVQLARPLMKEHVSTDGRWMPTAAGSRVRSWLGVPLLTRGRVIGVLNIDSWVAQRFSQRDVDVASAFANHAALALDNAQLYQDSVTRVEQEMEIAREIQSNFFPRPQPSRPGIAVAARCLPARETGGDFYDVLDLGAGRLAVLIGDVSGKSLPAAMLMAAARSTARSEARNHELPELVLSETNRWLVDDVPHGSFVALGYALIDARQKRLIYASGGQLSPLLRRHDGSVQYIEMSTPSLPLGIADEACYQQVEVALHEGDTLLFYTDGVVESHDRVRELYGFGRLEAFMRREGQRAPAEIVERLLDEVAAFAGEVPQHDDITVMVVRVGAA
jgi:GAF domain-containing protein